MHFNEVRDTILAKNKDDVIDVLLVYNRYGPGQVAVDYEWILKHQYGVTPEQIERFQEEFAHDILIAILRQKE